MGSLWFSRRDAGDAPSGNGPMLAGLLLASLQQVCPRFYEPPGPDGEQNCLQVLLDRLRLLGDRSLHLPAGLGLRPVAGQGVLLPGGLVLVRGAGRPHGSVLCRSPNVQLVLVPVRPGAAGVQRADRRARERVLREPSQAVLSVACSPAGLPVQVLVLVLFPNPFSNTLTLPAALQLPNQVCSDVTYKLLLSMILPSPCLTVGMTSERLSYYHNNN